MIRGDRIEVKHDACTRERLDREQPRECDGCDGCVSLAEIKSCVDTESYWVEVGKVSKNDGNKKGERVANRI
jgi:hypothetical protein